MEKRRAYGFAAEDGLRTGFRAKPWQQGWQPARLRLRVSALRKRGVVAELPQAGLLSGALRKSG